MHNAQTRPRSCAADDELVDVLTAIWKGPLRIIKQNIDDRERVIITGGAHNA